MPDFKFETLKEKYIKFLADKILIKVEDLSPTEKSLIEQSFILFEEKMEDIKVLNDENRRITNELLNYRSMNDNKDYDDDEE